MTSPQPGDLNRSSPSELTPISEALSVERFDVAIVRIQSRLASAESLEEITLLSQVLDRLVEQRGKINQQNEIVKDGANRRDEITKQGEHRRWIEKTQLLGKVTLSVTGILAGVILSVTGSEKLAYSVIGGSLALASVEAAEAFVKARKDDR